MNIFVGVYEISASSSYLLSNLECNYVINGIKNNRT